MNEERFQVPPWCSHVERTLETFCNMNLVMQETKNIAKINKQASSWAACTATGSSKLPRALATVAALGPGSQAEDCLSC